MARLIQPRSLEFFDQMSESALLSLHPAWYHNLLAHPDVIVERKGERYPMRAVVAVGQERERLFHQHAQLVQARVDDQAMTTRRIPIVILEPIDGGPFLAVAS